MEMDKLAASLCRVEKAVNSENSRHVVADFVTEVAAGRVAIQSMNEPNSFD